MSKFNTFIRLLKTPNKLIKVLGDKKVFNWLNDKQYLKLLFLSELGYKLDIDNPKTFNEKLHWLKLYDRNPLYNTLVDKYDVRKFVSDNVGDEYLIPLIGIYNKVDEIKWNNLPNKFVIKCTHGSGSNIICVDKKNLNIKDAKKKLNKWMKKNWYWFGREWPYKDVKPRIVIEEYIGNDNYPPKDYKFWVFNNNVKYINITFSVDNKKYINIYDLNWNLKNYSMVYPNDLTVNNSIPINFKTMIEISENLSKKIQRPFVRIDFFEVNNKLYMGEITLFPTSGLINFSPKEEKLDLKYGNLLNLNI